MYTLVIIILIKVPRYMYKMINKRKNLSCGEIGLSPNCALEIHRRDFKMLTYCSEIINEIKFVNFVLTQPRQDQNWKIKVRQADWGQYRYISCVVR
jgi:hypothetical protein